jgi:glutamate formiminotransferase
VGARRVLVAYNVNLECDRVEVARRIARAVRDRDGGLPGVKALGLALPGRGIVQVSMNLTDYERTDIPTAFHAIKREAEREGIRIRESELIGLAPAAAFGGASPGDLLFRGFTEDRLLERRLKSPV